MAKKNIYKEQMKYSAQELALAWEPNAFTEGAGYWRMRCPFPPHDDWKPFEERDMPNVAVWEKKNDEGEFYVWATCFSHGCGARDIVRSLNRFKMIKDKRAAKRRMTPQEAKKMLFEVQEGKCNVCYEEFKYEDLEVDHIQPKSKGGPDEYDNYQLLCKTCNGLKDNYMTTENARRSVKMQDEYIPPPKGAYIEINPSSIDDVMTIETIPRYGKEIDELPF